MIYCQKTKETANTYREYLKTNHWKIFRVKVLHEKAKCEICFDTNRLELHHKNYYCLGMETKNDVLCLCRPCHKLLHEFIGIIDNTIAEKTKQFITLMKGAATGRVKFVPKYVAGNARKPTFPKKKKKKARDTAPPA